MTELTSYYIGNRRTGNKLANPTPSPFDRLLGRLFANRPGALFQNLPGGADVQPSVLSATRKFGANR